MLMSVVHTTSDFLSALVLLPPSPLTSLSLTFLSNMEVPVRGL